MHQVPKEIYLTVPNKHAHLPSIRIPRVLTHQIRPFYNRCNNNPTTHPDADSKWQKETQRKWHAWSEALVTTTAINSNVDCTRQVQVETKGTLGVKTWWKPRPWCNTRGFGEKGIRSSRECRRLTPFPAPVCFWDGGFLMDGDSPVELLPSAQRLRANPRQRRSDSAHPKPAFPLDAGAVNVSWGFFWTSLRELWRLGGERCLVGGGGHLCLTPSCRDLLTTEKSATFKGRHSSVSCEECHVGRWRCLSNGLLRNSDYFKKICSPKNLTSYSKVSI